jgi:type I restriction enzyme S subunit
MLNLSQDKITEVSKILESLVPECEVMVFGSRVDGRAKPYSDLDLSIKSDQPLPLDRLAKLKLAFEESDLPFRVDVVDWARTGENFRKIIRKSAEAFPKEKKE